MRKNSLILSCTNPICTLLQIWFCTCLSINGHITILGFARAYVSAFTSFLSGQTVKTSALCRQVTLYPCSTVLSTLFREMAPLSITHISRGRCNKFGSPGRGQYSTNNTLLHVKSKAHEAKEVPLCLLVLQLLFRYYGWNPQLHRTSAHHSPHYCTTEATGKCTLNVVFSLYRNQGQGHNLICLEQR